MTKRKLKFDTSKELISHIETKLRIKPLKKDYNSLYVRKQSTIQRIINYLNTITIEAEYENKDLNMMETSHHYFLDIWVNDCLITIRCYKDLNKFYETHR